MNNTLRNNNELTAFQSAIAALTLYLSMWTLKLAKAIVPGHTACLLSDPEKMPGLSWGLPAHKSCPRQCGEICKDCYAAKGRYIMKNVVDAQNARFRWTVESMRTKEGRQAWILTMATAIMGQEYFRIHDSGDFFNVAYVQCWIEVCKLLPATKFWAPTRSYQGGVMGPLPVFDPLLNALRQLASLPNVTVRPSALNFGDAAPVVAGLHAGATVDNATPYQCPAKAKYDGHCGPCRHCWNNKTEAVSYPHH